MINVDDATRALLGAGLIWLGSAWLHERTAARRLKHVVADLQECNRQLADRACTDPVTGLGNRRLFDERLSEEWRRAVRDGSSLGLVLVDVDHFKQFNDRFGHLAGDSFLDLVGSCLCAAARRPGDVVARIGGDEFAVVLPGADADGTHWVGMEIEQAVRKLRVELAGVAGWQPGVSFGAASMRPDAQGRPSDLIQLSDTALYEGKRAGRAARVAGATGYVMPSPDVSGSLTM